MTWVVMEAHRDNDWVRIGAVHRRQVGGSLTSDEPDGRQIYIFGWLDDDAPGVWRSDAGFDIADAATRLVVSDGVSRLADLSDGEWFEMEIRRGDHSHRVRFAVRETAE